jgi:hypothetical protein
VQSSADTDPPTPAEPTGEAQEPYTRAECYTAWKFNMAECNKIPVPEVRYACWMARSAMLAACLKGADD